MGIGKGASLSLTLVESRNTLAYIEGSSFPYETPFGIEYEDRRISFSLSPKNKTIRPTSQSE